MKKSVKSFVIFFLIHIALFYLLPLLIVDTGSAMLILLAVIPLSCLAAAIVYGSFHSFHLGYPVLVALAFLPTVWIFFNESAWVYAPAYGGIALIGNLIGAGICHYRSSKRQDDSKP